MRISPQTEDSSSSIIEKDKSIRKLKRNIEGWREAIILIRSVLLWEVDWYPLLIVGIHSTICLIFWKIDPTILSTISILGLLMVTLDTLVPILSSKFLDPANWTGVKEKQFEDFCKTVIEYKILLGQYWTSFQGMRETQPKFYYSITVPLLCLLAWIGNWNNLILTYIFGMILLLIPGLIHHGYLQKQYRYVLLSLKCIIDNSINRKAKQN